MFTLWDTKYEDIISRDCGWEFDMEELDTGLPSKYKEAIEFRNKMNKISDAFLKKFKCIMQDTYGFLDITLAVPHMRPNSYGDVPSVYFEGIDENGRERWGTICRPMYCSIILNGTEDQQLNNMIIDKVIDDIHEIYKLMRPYWVRTNRQYSEIGYTCRENYFVKGDK